MVQKKFYDFLRNFRADSVFKQIIPRVHEHMPATCYNFQVPRGSDSKLQVCIFFFFVQFEHRRHDSLVIVELADVAAFDTELLTSLQKRPDFQLRLFEAAARDVLQRSVLPSIERIDAASNLASVPADSHCAPELSEIPSGHHAFDVQLALQSTQLSTPLRSLTAEHVGRLLKVSGIIVSACLRVVGECFRTLEGLARASKQQQRIARIATL